MKSLRFFFSICLAAALWCGAARQSTAAIILTFGQQSSGVTVNSVASGGSTTISNSGQSIAVDISQILAGISTPTTAYLKFNMTSTASAIGTGPAFQDFAGSFSITSNADGTGTNYLSGASFTGALFAPSGSPSALTFSSTGNPVFTSDVILNTNLGSPTGISWSFAGVVAPGTGSPQNPIISGGTFASFNSGISGQFNASAVPEPSTLMIAGFALAGAVLIRRRRRQ